MYPNLNKRIHLALIVMAFVIFGIATTVHADIISDVPCVNGDAAGFSCDSVDLVAWVPLEDLGGDPDNGVFANDNWAWVSPDTGNMYAMVGLRDATVFVDVTDSYNPIVLGELPSAEAGLSDYRDIKVYNNYAFIVGDVPYVAHGMQVFDLTQLDAVDRNTVPVGFGETAHYDGFGFGHNMWINEATGYAYIFRSDTCEAGTHMVNIQDPLNPSFAGCLVVDGADSDAECLIYNGPDAEHVGKEICFVGSDSTIGIADVTDKDNVVVLSNSTYPNISRAHQGVLTLDHQYWIISDTMDEQLLGFNTRTIIIDVSDLDNPVYVRYHEHETTARDHNVYMAGPNLMLQSNWRAGLRVIDIQDFDNWEEIGYFDTYPEDDGIAVKSGAWSHYDWLPNGVIVVSDVERGLFLLRITQDPTDVNLAQFDGNAVNTQIIWLTILGVLLASGATLIVRRRTN